MAQYLDTTGLQTLWNKLKETFVPKSWLMVDYSGTLQQTTEISYICPVIPITGDVGFYRINSSNVSGETKYYLYCIAAGNVDLCSCFFKAGVSIQNAIMTLIKLGIVSMSGNLTTGAQLTPLRKIVKFSDSEYLVPISSSSGSTGGAWIFYDNFNAALSALLGGTTITTETVSG